MVVDIAFRELVPFQVATASVLRRDLQSQMTAAGFSDRCTADATHVLFELVMNGVEHGRPDADGRLEVAWGVDGTCLWVSVLDQGVAADGQTIEVRAADPGSPRGRGLAMVEAFSLRWLADRGEGTRVSAWFDAGA